jgi:outer membrane scaffolding protein for murein synthesis (MipA/OmpV family)
MGGASRVVGAGLLSILAVFGAAARADEPDSSKIWSFTIGGGLAVAPRYEGADRERFQPVPFGSVTYRDTARLGPDGLAVTVLNIDGFTVAPTLGYGGGRKESADSDLKGLGTIQSALTVGVILKYQTGPFSFTITPREAVTHSNDGFVTNLAAAYAWQVAPRLKLSVGPTLSLVDGRYAQTYFGIDAQQSARSGKRVYSPDGGVKDVGLTGSLSFAIDEHWVLQTAVSDRVLVGDAADSPIVRSKNQLSAVTAIGYRF